jgi:hypothetical protein
LALLALTVSQPQFSRPAKYNHYHSLSIQLRPTVLERCSFIGPPIELSRIERGG